VAPALPATDGMGHIGSVVQTLPSMPVLTERETKDSHETFARLRREAYFRNPWTWYDLTLLAVRFPFPPSVAAPLWFDSAGR
jgi:hypothetical protein